MKKVLFAVSLVVNIALAGGLFYTITEMNKLDDQREAQQSVTNNTKGSQMKLAAPTWTLKKPQNPLQLFIAMNPVKP